MQSTTFTRSISAHTPIIYLGFFAIIISYYNIVPREWVLSDAVMTYGHSLLWVIIGVLLAAKQKGLAVQHQYTFAVVLLCGYIAFLAWFCVRALSYVT